MRYYDQPAVRQRIIEYLGGRSPDDATAVFISRSDAKYPDRIERHPPAELENYLAGEIDIARSLWDRKSLIAHIDIEYCNFDFPDEPYLDPHRSFLAQSVLVEQVQRILLNYGIAPLHLISGRGHHFVWRAGLESRAFGELAGIGRLPDYLKEVYAAGVPPADESVGFGEGAAFAGLGLLMEFLAHGIRAESVAETEIPLRLTAVDPGAQARGREIISIDISEYGDPLHTRSIRIPFSRYMKHKTRVGMPESDVQHELGGIFCIPVHEMDLETALLAMQDEERVKLLAESASTEIPDCADGTCRLVEDYHDSGLREFHDHYFEQSHEHPGDWASTYDVFDRGLLPDCIREICDRPNDLMLKPAELRDLTRTMLALGWHPRHIAGFVRSHYERDHGWGRRWYVYSAGYRADFYVRLFAGLVYTGADSLEDFNCATCWERRIAAGGHEDCGLDRFRRSLLERREHGRLARRPFNRLFLQD